MPNITPTQKNRSVLNLSKTGCSFIIALVAGTKTWSINLLLIIGGNKLMELRTIIMIKPIVNGFQCGVAYFNKRDKTSPLSIHAVQISDQWGIAWPHFSHRLFRFLSVDGMLAFSIGPPFDSTNSSTLSLASLNLSVCRLENRANSKPWLAVRTFRIFEPCSFKISTFSIWARFTSLIW